MQKIADKMLHNALEIGIVHVRVTMRPGRIPAAAVHRKSQTAALAHAGFACRIPAETFRHFKQTQPRRALRNIVAYVLQQTGGQFRAQHILLGGPGGS